MSRQGRARRSSQALPAAACLLLGLVSAAGMGVSSATGAEAPLARASAPALPTARLPRVSVPSVTVTTPKLPGVPSTTVTTPRVPVLPLPTASSTASHSAPASLPGAAAFSPAAPSTGSPLSASRGGSGGGHRPGSRSAAPASGSSRPGPATGARRGTGRRGATARSSAAARRRVRSAHSSGPRAAHSARPSAVGAGFLDRIGRALHLPLPVPDWSKPIIVALLLLCLGLGLRSRIASRRARGLERRQEALAADIDAMQAALVPEIPPRLGPLAVSVAYRPADGPAAGGDFYDAFTLGEGRTVVLLGDVSGHGRDALAHAARMRFTVRAYAEAGLAPREVLRLAGRAVGRNSDHHFTTVVVLIHDAAAGSLTYASAGHPPPVFLGPEAHEPLTVCSSPPLGWGVETGRRQTTIPFTAEDRVCLFSDGLVEARLDGELLGRERLSALMEELGPETRAPALLDRVRQVAGQVRDDMAACILKLASGTPSGAGATWQEELELDCEQLGRGQAERFLAAWGLDSADIETAAARARALAADHGAAVLTVIPANEACVVTASGAAGALAGLLTRGDGPELLLGGSFPGGSGGWSPAEDREAALRR